MFIKGGFAGHGAVGGVTVTPGELRRTCNDCRYSWSASEDEHTRRSTSCITRHTKEARPRDPGARSTRTAGEPPSPLRLP